MTNFDEVNTDAQVDDLMSKFAIMTDAERINVLMQLADIAQDDGEAVKKATANIITLARSIVDDSLDDESIYDSLNILIRLEIWLLTTKYAPLEEIESLAMQLLSKASGMAALLRQAEPIGSVGLVEQAALETFRTCTLVWTDGMIHTLNHSKAESREGGRKANRLNAIYKASLSTWYLHNRHMYKNPKVAAEAAVALKLEPLKYDAIYRLFLLIEKSTPKKTTIE